MQNLDPGAIGQSIINYLGGTGGGYILISALMVVGLLSALHVMHRSAFGLTFILGACSWFAAWLVKLAFPGA